MDEYCESVQSNFEMLNHREIDFPTFKMLIQSLPEEPEIKEQNYFEDYLEQKRLQEEQARANGQQPINQSQARANMSRIQASLAGSRSPAQPSSQQQNLQFVPVVGAQSRISNNPSLPPAMGNRR